MTRYYVYQWTNRVNGKRYIGKGTGDRARAHLWPKGPSLLSKAVNKYGREAFELRYLAVDMDEDLAFKVEMHCIEKLGTLAPSGYNRTSGGRGLPNPSQSTKVKLQGWVRGPVSVETRALLSKALKGIPKTREHVEKYAAALRGKARDLSEQARSRMAEAGSAHRGRKQTPEHIAKRTAARKSWTPSEETRRKMSESAKRRRKSGDSP